MEVDSRKIRENYLYRIAEQALRECRTFSKEQIMPILMALIGIWVALHLKVIQPAESDSDIVIALAGLSGGLVFYLSWQILRAPFVIDRVQRKQIFDLRTELMERPSETQQPPPQPGLPDPILEAKVIPRSSWGPRGQKQTVFSACVSVRNVGSARTILKDWTLVVPARDLYISVNPPENEFTGNMQQLKEQIAHRKRAIDPGDALEFGLIFLLPIPSDQLKGTKTEIRFRDVKNKWHVVAWTFPN